MDEAAAFLSSAWSLPPGAVRLEPIHGGLESSVARGTVTTTVCPPGTPRHFIVKELRGTQRREASIYGSLWRALDEPPAARLLGVQPGADADYLFLEDVRPECAWPWLEPDAVLAVCRELARLHDTRGLHLPSPGWDYEAELLGSAASTLDAAVYLRSAEGATLWRPMGDLRRVIAALPEIRRRLLEHETVVLHGDVHPGNVMVCGDAAPRRVALIDWARARAGSPLEDIASWLHSLGCWEPELRRRHDSLLRAYLDARAEPRALTPTLREDYWLASACNALSGAIRYNLAVLGDRAAHPHTRAYSALALREWQRLIRGAAVILRKSTSH